MRGTRVNVGKVQPDPALERSRATTLVEEPVSFGRRTNASTTTNSRYALERLCALPRRSAREGAALKIPDNLMEQARAIVNARLRLANCAACQNNNWHLDSTLYEVRESLGGASLTLVDLYCGVCGHQMFLNAYTIGLVKDGRLVLG
jgi:hypothetical protein